jgi:hypothetical protein
MLSEFEKWIAVLLSVFGGSNGESSLGNGDFFIFLSLLFALPMFYALPAPPTASQVPNRYTHTRYVYNRMKSINGPTNPCQTPRGSTILLSLSFDIVMRRVRWICPLYPCCTYILFDLILIPPLILFTDQPSLQRIGSIFLLNFQLNNKNKNEQQLRGEK